MKNHLLNTKNVINQCFNKKHYRGQRLRTANSNYVTTHFKLNFIQNEKTFTSNFYYRLFNC